eukprot:11960905-Karenia_brevis.AAC.1
MAFANHCPTHADPGQEAMRHLRIHAMQSLSKCPFRLIQDASTPLLPLYTNTLLKWGGSWEVHS